MSISDELRELSSEAGIYSNTRTKLRKLADRIDAERVELPRDKDGVPIHMGDEVWTTFNHQANVIRICILRESAFVLCEYPDEEKAFLKPYDLTHEYPDSLERIANDIEAAEDWRDGDGEYGTGVSSVEESTLQEWADRIRKLAEKEDENGNQRRTPRGCGNEQRLAWRDPDLRRHRASGRVAKDGRHGCARW